MGSRGQGAAPGAQHTPQARSPDCCFPSSLLQMYHSTPSRLLTNAGHCPITSGVSRAEGSSLLCGYHTASRSRLMIVLLAPFLSPQNKAPSRAPQPCPCPGPLKYFSLHGCHQRRGSGTCLDLHRGPSGDPFNLHWTLLQLSQDQLSLPEVDPSQH